MPCNSLLSYSTFRTHSLAKYVACISSLEEIESVLRDYSSDNILKLPIGEGSNILFRDYFDGLVIKNKISGAEIVYEDEERIKIKVGGGESWHKLVVRCVEMGWGGIENLSLIPGSVGAAPVQNIGAYGTELKDVIESLDWYDFENGFLRNFSAEQCKFSYRDSVFKHELKDKGIITHVVLVLQKNPSYNLSYPSLASRLKEHSNLSLKIISDAVISIRREKIA